MPYPQFDRHQVLMKPLSSRYNKTAIEKDHVPVDRKPSDELLSSESVQTAVARIRSAREKGRSVMMAFGAHTIKNGMGPTLIELIENGWITHLATNGAGVIHDWEFSFQGKSSEDVEVNVSRGEFGNWQETGFYINLALNIGAYEGKGYGESVGALIQNEELKIPSVDQLEKEVLENVKTDPVKSSSAAQLLSIVKTFELTPGPLKVPHPWKRFSIQAAAYRLGVPLTGHPMFGHDIIYNHPMNNGSSLGRVAERDFLTYANNVGNLTDGVYLSIGSAVMSPMVFEKSLSICQNVAIQNDDLIKNHFILVVDLAKSHWDWSKGEPPETNPDYYLRYNKSFSRMGGEMRYLTADNRDFLLALLQTLQKGE